MDIEKEKILRNLEALVENFNPEVLKGHSLVLRFKECYPRCKACPHGPYWYRAIFSSKKNRWTFRYIGKTVNKGQLYPGEYGSWDTISYYDREVGKLRTQLTKLKRGGSAGRKGSKSKGSISLLMDRICDLERRLGSIESLLVEIVSSIKSNKKEHSC